MEQKQFSFHQTDQHYESFTFSWPPIRVYLVKASGGRVVSSAGRVELEFELWTWGEQLRYSGENARQQQRESHNLAGSAVLGGSCGERPKPRPYGVLPRSGKWPERNSAAVGRLWVSGAGVCRAKFNCETKLKVCQIPDFYPSTPVKAKKIYNFWYTAAFIQLWKFEIVWRVQRCAQSVIDRTLRVSRNVIPGMWWGRATQLAVWSKWQRREAWMAVWSKWWQSPVWRSREPWQPSHLATPSRKCAWECTSFKAEKTMKDNASHHFWAFEPPMNANTNVPTQQMLQTANQEDSDFINALLTGSDSVSGSPLWSPTPSDSGISEDSPSDQGDSPQRPESPQGHPQYFAPRPPTKTSPEASFPSESDQQAFRYTDYIGYKSVKKKKINVCQTLNVIRTYAI